MLRLPYVQEGQQDTMAVNGVSLKSDMHQAVLM